MANLKTKLTLTERKVAEMLRENTGRHLLDSGGAYGRHWEMNQSRDFARENPATLSGKWGLEFSVKLYHFLTDKLTYDPVMQRKLSNFARRADQRENPWLVTMKEFVEHEKEKAEQNGAPFGGIYGEGDPVTVNSYNEENVLDQTIQFVYWEDEDGDHVLLQVHGGCDVRGGYTAPKAFQCTGELSIFDYRRGGIYCTRDARNTEQTEIPGIETPECNESWYTDDGYHWYPREDYQAAQLEEYDVVKEEDEDPEDVEEPHGWRKGILYVKEDGTVLCPHCGSKLEATLH